MNSIRTIIIDDDKSNLTLLRNLCDRYIPEIEIVSQATHVQEAIEQILQHRPQLLLLDIELNGKTAFDILESIDDMDLYIIFITAHDKYAIQAVKHQAIDYVLKPIQIQELVNAVKKVTRRNKLVASKPNTEKEFLAIPTKNYIELIPFNQIVHLESDNSYTIITTSEQKKIISTRSLKENESELPPFGFIRVHNSHIVNIQWISRVIKAKNSSLLLTNGMEVPISSNRKKEILEMLNLG